MAAPSAPVMGFNGKAYYNTGTYGSPTWSLISNMGDVEVTDEMTEVELPLRAGAGFMFYAAGMRKLGFAWKMMHNPGDTAYTALQTAYAARTAQDFLFLDQAQGTAGSAGTRALTNLTKFARQEPLDGVMMTDVVAKPSYSANVPSLYTAS